MAKEILRHIAVLILIVTFSVILMLAMDYITVPGSNILGILYLCVLLPAITLVYSLTMLKYGRIRLLLSVICPLTLTLALVIFASAVNAGGWSFLRVALLFLWCECWSLLGLIRRKKAGSPEK